ncbi:MAG: CvpA family protein [Anaerolineales bacterium]|nr:CvpA family protein [Anaerolineales bacterium]
MISLTIVFYMYVALFGLIGAMRGWAKELLVVFSVILALTFTTLIERYVPFVRDVMPGDSTALFWLRSTLLVVLVIFGYQTPNIQRFAPKMRREKLQDTLLGIFLGALNGYLIFGTVLFYMSEADFPFGIITSPVAGTPLGQAALDLLEILPPRLLGVPAIYFAVVLAFIFVIVVFV